MSVDESAAPRPEGRRLLWLGLFFVVLGVACRLVRYGLHFPIWGDEASLALNFTERDYLGLLRQLNYYQVAPILFLWVEKSVYLLAGPSELALRLFPLVAGVSALVLFGRLARETVPPAAAALAVGILAVSQWPIEMASTIKPYAIDLLVAVLLLWLAAGFLRTRRLGFLAALALTAPLAVGLSYPSVFVAGAVSLVLLPVLYREKVAAPRVWFVAYNVLLVGCFLAQLALVGRGSVAGNPPDLDGYMKEFWYHGFPPGGAAKSLWWGVRVHFGRMLSHPVTLNGGGLVGLALVCLGGRRLVREGRGSLAALCLLPFALHLAAAVLHRYPYGMHPRLEQHLLPGFCLLAGAGLGSLAELALRTTSLRRWGLAAVAVCLALVGLGGMAIDWHRPYQNEAARWAGDIGHHLRREMGPDDRIVVRPALEAVPPDLRWQLVPYAHRLHREGAAPSARLWILDANCGYTSADAPEPAFRVSVAGASGTSWEITGRRRFFLDAAENPSRVFRFCCDVVRCEPSPSGSVSRSPAAPP